MLAIGCGDDAPIDGSGGSAGMAGAGGTAGMAGMGGGGGSAGSGGIDFTPPSFGRWEKFEPPGAVCSNGSQYKYFVNFSETSDNVIFYFAGGGACWDYESCVSGGARGAANPNGLPDDHAIAHVSFNVDGNSLSVGADVVYPLLSSNSAVSPMSDWNKVFVPYCTGDVYSGSNTATYEDPDGIEDDVEFHHMGHTNVLAMIQQLNGMFSTIPKMFVGGCSAGGAGAIVNYYSLRTGLNDVQDGYLLNDSGPLYPDQEMTSRSLPLHNRVRTSWDADALIEEVADPAQVMRLKNDFGELSEVLAEEFPNDRLAMTYFQLDYNYSLYSYERFWSNASGSLMEVNFGEPGLDEDDALDRASVYSLWKDDTDLLRTQYDAVDNLGYFLPFYRNTNSSHCSTIPGFDDLGDADLLTVFTTEPERLSWAGTDMMTTDGTMDVLSYAQHLLDDSTPLKSYFESTGEGVYLSCTPDAYDEDDCIDAVACVDAMSIAACEALQNP